MWIRSQNKKFLVNTNHIEVEGTEKEYWITAMDVDYVSNKPSNVLGDYATEERALQILDEIQEHIEADKSALVCSQIVEMGFKVTKIKDPSFLEKAASIYQMPAE